jgi:hypothetical protein
MVFTGTLLRQQTFFSMVINGSEDMPQNLEPAFVQIRDWGRQSTSQNNPCLGQALPTTRPRLCRCVSDKTAVNKQQDRYDGACSPSLILPGQTLIVQVSHGCAESMLRFLKFLDPSRPILSVGLSQSSYDACFGVIMTAAGENQSGQVALVTTCDDESRRIYMSISVLLRSDEYHGVRTADVSVKTDGCVTDWYASTTACPRFVGASLTLAVSRRACITIVSFSVRCGVRHERIETLDIFESCPRTSAWPGASSRGRSGQLLTRSRLLQSAETLRNIFNDIMQPLRGCFVSWLVRMVNSRPLAVSCRKWCGCCCWGC